MLNRIWYGIAVVGLLLNSGCSKRGGSPPKAYPAQGKVLMENNQPLAKGKVVFTPEKLDVGREVWAPLQSDGTFVLSSYAEEDGAVPGSYRVHIELADPSSGKKAPDAKVPSKYLSPDTTPIVVEVAKGDNRFEWKLDSR